MKHPKDQSEESGLYLNFNRNSLRVLSRGVVQCDSILAAVQRMNYRGANKRNQENCLEATAAYKMRDGGTLNQVAVVGWK